MAKTAESRATRSRIAEIEDEIKRLGAERRLLETQAVQIESGVEVGDIITSPSYPLCGKPAKVVGFGADCIRVALLKKDGTPSARESEVQWWRYTKIEKLTQD